MEKFTNPKRGNAPSGCIRIPLRYLPTSNEQLLPFLLISFFTLMGGSLFAQGFTLITGSSNPLNNFNVGGRSVPVFVDIDNDCDKDLFAGNQAGEILFYKNNGTASAPVFVQQLGAANPFDGYGVASNAKPAFIDIDADGDLDCFVGSGDGSISAFKNTGTSSVPSFNELTGPNSVFFDGNPFDGVIVGSNASPAFMDYDNDGDYDCFVGRSNSTNSIRYFRNEDSDYNPSFSELTGGSNPLSNAFVVLGGVAANGDISSNACLTAVNLDADSDIDVYVGVANGTFRYFRNNAPASSPSALFSHFASGSGPLDVPSMKDVGPGSTDYSSPTFVDIDGDGDLDCFSGINAGRFIYYRNDATLVPRTITCKPYSVNLDPLTGTVTVNPATVDPEDLFLSTTFTCPAELTFTVSGTTTSFTCSAADNTLSLTGAADLTLTLTATDAASNTATCSASVYILDKTPPVPALSPLPVLSRDICRYDPITGQFTAPDTIPVPNGIDVCDGTRRAVRVQVNGGPIATVTTTLNGGPMDWDAVAIPGDFALGTYTLTWIYEDGTRGNTSTQTQTLNIVSNTPPTFTNCPGNLVFLNNQISPCGYQVAAAWTPLPTPVDCETIVSLTSNYTPSSFFPIGVTNVVYAAQDAGGNTGYCNFTVTVSDITPPTVTINTPPIITAPYSTTVTCGTLAVTTTTSPGQCGRIVTWTAPNITASDNCGGIVTTTVSHPSGTLFPVGTTTVTYTATDAGGTSTIFCTFSIQVTDAQAPSITCPNSITVPTAPNSCTSVTINLTLPVATDNCGTPTVTETTPGPPMGGWINPRSVSLPLGTTTFQYLATDVNGNSAGCSFAITVQDQQAPSFGATCPGNQVLVADISGNCSKNATWATPTVTDNCTVSTVTGPTFTLVTSAYLPSSATLTSGDFHEGTTRVSYNATDGAGNSATCSFTIKVTNTTPPTITCPLSPVVVSAGANCLYTLAAVAGVSSTATPSCDPGTITYRQAPSTPLTIGSSTFGLGTFTLIAIATDASNNSSTCSLTLQVIDNTGPVLQPGTCPPNITVNSDASAACGVNQTWNAPVWVDNCPANTIVVSRATSPVGMTPNTATLLANNSGGFFPVGTTTVNFTAKDGPAITANVGTPCAFSVTVVDDDKPSITNCPAAPIAVNAGAGCTGTYTLFTPTITDNGCSTALAVTYTANNSALPASGTFAPLTTLTLQLGTTTITYNTSDAAGNTTACVYTVQVSDMTPPALTCPSNQIVITGICTGTPSTWADPTPTDNCPGLLSISAPIVVSTTGASAPVLTGTPGARGGTFPVGVTTLRYTAWDNASPSNSATCTFTIDVRENTAPTITCAVAPQIIPAGAGCVTTVTSAMLTQPTVSDNCPGGINVAIISPTFPNTYGVGTYSVNWRATDVSGNTANCSSTFTIQDQGQPTLTCNTFTVQVDVPFNNFIPSSAPTFTPKTAPFITVSDNCTPLTLASVSANPPLLPQYPVGVSYIYWQVSDGNGNTNTCSQQVVVTPNPASCTPTTTTLTCPPTLTAQIDAPGCPASVSFTPASLGISAVDNCGNVIAVTASASTLSATASVTFSAGGPTPTSCTRTVTVVLATEVCGNSIDDDCNTGTPDACSPCSPDVTNPVFASCPPTVTLNAEPGESFALSSNLPALTATDACPGTVTIDNDAPPELFDGDVVSWTATDATGNDALCEQTIIIILGGGGGGCFDQANLSPEFALDGAGGDLYGSSIDIDGTLAIVGAPYDDNGKGVNSGAAYILVRNGSGGWDEIKKLVVPDGDADDLFGDAVAISGGTVIVGATRAFGKGAAYIFSQNEGGANNWGVVKKLLASDGAGGDDFGASVDISGDYAAVGAVNDDAPQVNRGSFYLYERNFGGANNWGERVRRSSSDGATNDNFGISVSIDGSTVLVGARYDDESGSNSGAAFTFVRDFPTANNWGQTQKLLASDLAAGDYFGSSVAISGNNLVVGSYLDDNAGGNNAGAAYVFSFSGSWTEVAKLIASDATIADQFGISVDIDAGTVIVGSQFDDDMGTNSGSAYIYTEGSGWAEVDKLLGSAVTTNDNFGRSVAVDGPYAGVGAFKDDLGSSLDQGSAYFYEDNCPLRPANAVERSSNVIKNSSLRCFPNPSTDVINIEFTLEEEENVQVRVMNAMGQVVSTLLDGKVSGESRFQWEGAQFGNGMYFIRIESATMRELIPVVIVR